MQVQNTTSRNAGFPRDVAQMKDNQRTVLHFKRWDMLFLHGFQLMKLINRRAPHGFFFRNPLLVLTNLRFQGFNPFTFSTFTRILNPFAVYSITFGTSK